MSALVGCSNSDVRTRSLVFCVPGRKVGVLKVATKVHIHRQFYVSAWADIAAEPRIGLTAAGQDEHHSPVGPAEYSCEGRFVGCAWFCRSPRMGVQPQPRKLLGLSAGVHLSIEEVGNG